MLLNHRSCKRFVTFLASEIVKRKAIGVLQVWGRVCVNESLMSGVAGENQNLGLSRDASDTIINIGNFYKSYRLDRPTPGGGVLAYIKTDLPTKRLSELEEERNEVLWLLFKAPGTLTDPTVLSF